MSYVEGRVPPVREARLKTGTSFGGCAKELLGCSKQGCLVGCDRSFTQTVSCQMYLALQMVMTIPNSVTIMHGPLGCGSQSHMLDFTVRSGSAARGFTRGPVLWLSTNLNESDVINGGESKLREAILQAERDFAPQIIFIATTCAPSIIGDDVDEVANSLRERIHAKIVPLHCPGFKTKIVASAYDTVYHGLLKYLDLQPKPYIDYRPFNPFDPSYDLALQKYQYRKAHTVNLINASSIGAPDEDELVRLLSALDLNVRVFTEFTKPDDFRLLTEAALNISMCNVHDDYLLSYLEEAYGIPYIIHNMPVGIENTRAWLLEIAKRFGLEERAEALIADEEEKLEQALTPLREKMRGKRALLSGGVIRVASTAHLLAELGLEVIAIRPYHYDDLSDPIYERFGEQFPDVPINVSSNQVFELVNILKREKPDICFAHVGSNGWIAKTGVVSIPLFSANAHYFGYTGVYELARRIVRALQNPALSQRAGQHIRLPYKQTWYERDPFSYILQRKESF